MGKKRAAGILLHPASLPSQNCIGDLGPRAYQFVDFIQASGARLWQVLPLGPAGCGESPYDSPSAFAGNTYLISLNILMEKGFLPESDLQSTPCLKESRINYGNVRRWKLPLLEKAAEKFLESGEDDAYPPFCRENSWWLDDYALFQCLKDHYGTENWDPDITAREKNALARWSEKKRDAIEKEKVLQYFFFSQWKSLKNYANSRQIRIIGDIPIFVSLQSADFWANRRLFHTDKNGAPTVVAGVPPDYFSSTGQLWGNPLYDWNIHKKEGYSWWLRRIGHLAEMTDIIRIDHFRGFEAYWAVPALSKTAEKGQWVKAPGADFFKKVREQFPDLQIMAEDLGVITDEVRDLRDTFHFPGMKVMQFGFEGGGDRKLDPSNVFLPFNYTSNSVVYSGTHDNNTTRGWYNNLPGWNRDLIRRYLARPDDDIVWDIIREGMKSCADFAVFPMQDILDLGEEARMNLPSTVGGNWSWKMQLEDLDGFAGSRFREMAELYGRM